MDKITKAHYRFVRQALESKDKETRTALRKIIKGRAVYIKEMKKHKSSAIQAHFLSVIFGLQTALSELGIDIKRYEG